MQNYEQIFAELEIEIPEDKKAEFKRRHAENYKTIADYNKQVEKTKRYQSEIEEAQRKQAENQEAVELKEQIETLERQIQEEKDARAKENNQRANKENVEKFLSGKKFVNSIIADSINKRMLEALEEDNTRSLDEVLDKIVPPQDRDQVFISDRKLPAFTTKFNQKQPPEQKEKGIDKLNSMSLTEKMLLRKNDIGQYKRLQRNK